MNIKSALRAFPPDTVILREAKNLGTWYMPHMRQMAVNTGRRGGAAGAAGCAEGLTGPAAPKVLRVLKFDSGLWPLRVVVAAGAAISSQRYGISLPTRIGILSASAGLSPLRAKGAGTFGNTFQQLTVPSNLKPQVPKRRPSWKRPYPSTKKELQPWTAARQPFWRC